MPTASQVYYGSIGRGDWQGTFVFEVRSWRRLWTARVGIGNLALVVTLLLVQRVLGAARIQSQIRDESALVFTNVYRLRKLGITLCEFRDLYRLRDDGTRVDVRTDLRYGPIPGILRSRVEYEATISNGGFVSRYDGLALLGSVWIGRYWVHPDQDRVSGVLTCTWAEAFEYMFRS